LVQEMYFSALLNLMDGYESERQTLIKVNVNHSIPLHHFYIKQHKKM